MKNIAESLLSLITETATNLPEDVRRAVAAAAKLEAEGTQSMQAIRIIHKNVDMAADLVQPICQDTGMPTFVVHTPVGINQIELKASIKEAVMEATRRGKLRPNSVDSITGKNSGLNVGPGTPVIHFEQWEQDYIEVLLLLKGGGCENKNIQYSLPADLPGMGNADRTLEGVYKCILHAVWQAQGQGCSQGFIGVCIGGDRTTGYEGAKSQLFREVDDTNEIPELKEMEERIMGNADKLGIGTMGFGGKVTLLGCKIGALNRLPASFFVSVAYNCWAYRRLSVHIDPATGSITKWNFRDEKPSHLSNGEIPTTGHEVVLNTPVTEEQVRALKVGDMVVINGPMFTGRDALHKYLMTHDSPADLSGAALYHCGPVMLKDDAGNWTVKAAGPTTSSREEPYVRNTQTLWRTNCHRQRWHGIQNAKGIGRIWRCLPQCYWRRSTSLCRKYYRRNGS